jgi:hypothetical protein
MPVYMPPVCMSPCRQYTCRLSICRLSVSGVGGGGWLVDLVDFSYVNASCGFSYSFTATTPASATLLQPLLLLLSDKLT